MHNELQIKEFKDFKCTGGECPDSCCHSWNITIDKKTLKKYKNTKNFKMDNIVNLDGNDCDKVAYIKLKENKSCPFLNENKLCDIHASYGAEYLSATCKQYPRVNNHFNGIVEKHIALSCPVAVDVLINSKEPLEFDLDSSKKQLKGFHTIVDINTIHFSKDTYFDIRSLIITILQDRTLNLKDRLSIVKKFCEFVDLSIVNKVSDDEFSQYIIELETKYKEYFPIKKSISIEDEVSFEVFQLLGKSLIPMFSIKKSENIEFNNYTKNITKHFEDLDANNISKVLKVIDLTFKDYEYVFENYLVHNVFSNIMPIVNKTSIESYTKLLHNLLILKTTMVGLFINKETLTKEDLRNSIYYFERNINHSKKNTKELTELLRNANINDDIVLSLILN